MLQILYESPCNDAFRKKGFAPPSDKERNLSFHGLVLDCDGWNSIWVEQSKAGEPSAMNLADVKQKWMCQGRIEMSRDLETVCEAESRTGRNKNVKSGESCWISGFSLFQGKIFG